jgi:HJR/Mrr/RecB family endonuclease
MSDLKILREKSANELKRQANVIIGVAAFVMFIVATFLFFIAIASHSEQPLLIAGAVVLFLIASGMIVMMIINRRAEDKIKNRFMSEVYGVASSKATEIDDVSPEQFSIVCTMMFLKCGYRVKLGSPDSMEGASIIVKKRGIRRTRVRCELAIGRISPDLIKQFAISKRFHRHSDLMIITNGYLMKPSRELAEQYGIKVIERDKLQKILKSASLKPLPSNSKIARTGK